MSKGLDLIQRQQPEIIDGFPTGNIYIGVTKEELTELEKELKEYKQYKAIEQELGIDLATLFKALDKKQRIFVLNEYDMRVVELPVRYASRKLVDGEIFINISGCFANFKIKDYGKWWALTKEELE